MEGAVELTPPVKISLSNVALAFAVGFSEGMGDYVSKGS
jgi:hypothetical protein